jgi:hypothetical protein
MSETYIPIACDLSAIPADERENHIATAPELFKSVTESRELPNGYAFRFPAETETVLKIAHYIANERLCCPFFGFTIEVEPGQAGLWLHLTGTPEVKQFMKLEMSSLIPLP